MRAMIRRRTLAPCYQTPGTKRCRIWGLRALERCVACLRESDGFGLSVRRFRAPRPERQTRGFVFVVEPLDHTAHASRQPSFHSLGFFGEDNGSKVKGRKEVMLDNLRKEWKGVCTRACTCASLKNILQTLRGNRRGQTGSSFCCRSTTRILEV